MLSPFRTVLPAVLVCGVLFAAPAQTPPLTWQEHWFEHDQVVTRVYFDDDIALYFDNGFTDAERDAALAWMVPYIGKLWNYTVEKYGAFGTEGRLYGIFHDGRYPGGHPATYLSPTHDFRNVVDCGAGPWTSPSYSVLTHEVAHVVEFGNNGVRESPAFQIWGDSKWAEIYQYDVYLGLGMTEQAQDGYNSWINNSDDFPRAGTYWFRDWYYPLYRDYGGTRLLVRFFKLLSTHFPKGTVDDGNGPIQKYTRGLTWGEYVYFMGAAARADLRKQARKAFGWSEDWEQQYAEAQTLFPTINPGRNYPTIFGKKVTVKRVAAGYRLQFRIRDQNGIDRVIARAGGQKLRARGKKNIYTIVTKKNPKSAKLRVIDRQGNKANKRIVLR